MAAAIQSATMLWLGTSVSHSGLVWARRAYMYDKPILREQVAKGAFLEEMPTKEAMAASMREVFSHYPSTVSEMIHETGSSHGVVFRALMLAGSVLALRANLLAIAVPAGQPGEWEVLLHTCRTCSIFLGGFLIALTPSPHGIFERFSTNFEANQDALDYLLSVDAQNKLHANAAVLTFFFSPLLELIALFLDISRFAGSPVPGYTAMSDWSVASTVLGGLLLVRALNLFTCFYATCFFTRQFTKGLAEVSTLEKLKTFWSEYSICLAAIRMAQLVALCSTFAGAETAAARPAILECCVVAVAVVQGFGCAQEDIRSVWAMQKGMDYSTDDLVWAFKRLRKRHLEMKKVAKENLDRFKATFSRPTSNEVANQSSSMNTKRTRQRTPRRRGRSPAAK